jgi:hypothetical protein
MMNASEPLTVFAVALTVFPVALTIMRTSYALNGHRAGAVRFSYVTTKTHDSLLIMQPDIVAHRHGGGVFHP